MAEAEWREQTQHLYREEVILRHLDEQAGKGRLPPRTDCHKCCDGRERGRVRIHVESTN